MNYKKGKNPSRKFTDDHRRKLSLAHLGKKLPLAYYPELRFAIDNGRTLCKDCHRKTDTYGNYREKKI